jgi:poly-gamma-glutamate synthesis protein (capsule biosynthesis protein)
MSKYSKVIIIILIFVPVFLSVYNTDKEVSLIAVGDILLDRGVRREIVDKGYDYPYLKVKKLLSSADITFGNLECPISDRGNQVFKRPDIIFRADKENAIELKKAGFDILNLANNHSMDYGSTALMDTIKVLEKNNITPLGAGQNKAAAHKPIFINKKGLRIGLLGYSIFPPEGYVSLDDKPDVSKADIDTIVREINATKQQCDILVVSFHWGTEYQFYAGEMQKQYAHTAVDSGADLILGHHPHVLQELEWYKDKLILYSLGNFVFDRQIQPGTDETAIAKIIIQDKKIKSVEFIPIQIVNSQPKRAEK